MRRPGHASIVHFYTSLNGVLRQIIAVLSRVSSLLTITVVGHFEVLGDDLGAAAFDVVALQEMY